MKLFLLIFLLCSPLWSSPESSSDEPEKQDEKSIDFLSLPDSFNVFQEDGYPDLMPFSLQNFVTDVVQRNAGALFQKLQTRISEEQIEYERGILDPNFFFNVKRGITDQPNDTQEALSRNYQTEYTENKDLYEIGYKGLSPSGVEWTLHLSYDRQQSSIIDKYRTYDHEHTSMANLSMRKPMAKGKGKNSTRIKINLAKVGVRMEMAQYQKKLMDTIAQAIQLYWRMYGYQKLYSRP